MVIIEKKTFKVRRKTNYGSILWLIVIVCCVIGFLVAANYSDRFRLKGSEEKGTEEEQSRGKKQNGNKKPIKKKSSVKINQEEVNSESGDNDNYRKDGTDEMRTETIFDIDEEISDESQEKVFGGSEKTSEESRGKSQNGEGETTDNRVKNEEGGENNEKEVLNPEIGDDEIIEELKTKISTNAPEQYQQIERNVGLFKNSIEGLDRERLERQKSSLTNTREQVKGTLQRQNVQNDEQWRGQVEEGLLETVLKIKEIENRLKELPND
jgi:hypothetical protein